MGTVYFFLPLGLFTAADRAAPALNLATVLAAIFISLPVCGLRPVRASRLVALKVPKPMNCTLSPLARDAAIVSSVALTASAAAV